MAPRKSAFKKNGMPKKSHFTGARRTHAQRKASTARRGKRK